MFCFIGVIPIRNTSVINDVKINRPEYSAYDSQTPVAEYMYFLGNDIWY